MLKPLEQFICDECGGLIEKPEDGYIEWLTYKTDEGKNKARGFRIVHHGGSSPRKHIKSRCYKYDGEIGRSDIDLKYYLNNVHQQLFALLDLGLIHDPKERVGSRIEDFKEFADFARRLTIPYYEEARCYFNNIPTDSDIRTYNEISFYTEETLKEIIKEYPDD